MAHTPCIVLATATSLPSIQTPELTMPPPYARAGSARACLHAHSQGSAPSVGVSSTYTLHHAATATSPPGIRTTEVLQWSSPPFPGSHCLFLPAHNQASMSSQV